ncbi:MAG: YxeA family protein [Vagococcus sp.]|uniref:YxeA family protein n=1 Tax=Vagococcus sp. TaxID=1933889 RepID=UPI002FC63D8D
MKRSYILFIGLFILLGGVFFGSPLLTKNNTSDAAMVIDLFNPFVKNTEVYVKTTDDYVTTYKSGGSDKDNYVYETVSVNEKGQKRELKYVSFEKKLSPNKYLKVTTKGQDVRRWAEVEKSEVPEKTLKELK